LTVLLPAHYYRIFCGISRQDLSYDDCFAFRRSALVIVAHDAGATETIALNLTVVGVEVYVGVIAYDASNNGGEMSNVPSVFKEGTTSTTTASTTISTGDPW
jgi:hypothetical protein